jgi:hypothetical protein
MPRYEPPIHYEGTPNRYLLRRGSCLWRVHSRRYAAFAFKSPPASVLYGGARFDATQADRYPYFYAGLSEETALAETLLRGVQPDDRGYRAVPREEVSERQLSGLALIQDLSLVSLVNAEDLAAIGQDAWLVTAPGHDYPQTRDWAHWLRRQAMGAHGLIWDSLRDRGGLAAVLFGDRLARDFGDDYEKTLLHEITELAVNLDGAAGTAWVNERLRRYRAAVPPPRSPRGRA